MRDELEDFVVGRVVVEAGESDRFESEVVPATRSSSLLLAPSIDIPIAEQPPGDENER